ncbi:hypothetical protein [Nocardioides alpinus]|uniref:hypothetical protein n=1 Tax=Nocardioides alpinus TaxID=748909 RepID=UPI0012FE8F97|nr:hypothetical protein [Nocardioides alpinus]
MQSPQDYVDSVLLQVRPQLLDRIHELADRGSPLPEPRELALLLGAGLPAAGPVELDPHFADLGPFYDSAGALHQLGNVTKQALASRRTNETVLAMRTGDGQWLYPAWQFTGDGGIRPALVPVLKALRGLDRWAAGVWLVAAHPDLSGSSPRQALRAGADPATVACLARRDAAALAA